MTIYEYSDALLAVLLVIAGLLGIGLFVLVRILLTVRDIAQTSLQANEHHLYRAEQLRGISSTLSNR